jgi:hypothetical protein
MTFTDKSPRLDKIVEDGDSLNWVEKINQLPEQQKIVVQMWDVDNMSFEIAQILQMNETAIRVALSRARKIKGKYIKFTVMELNKIERLVEKYFDGETSVEEEKESKVLCIN